MVIFSIFAFILPVVSILSLIVAIKGKHQYYWISAIGIYVFSFIAGFSIGQITVALTFIPLALAIGYSLHLIKNKSHFTMCTTIGIIIGVLLITFIDDAWLFFPFTFLNLFTLI